MSTVDRVFIVVDTSDSTIGGNQSKCLMRYQFMEGLARIANAKYKETGVKETFGEALETLV